MQALVAGGRHEIRTVRVRDRFGDYGLVGLVIAERGRRRVDARHVPAELPRARPRRRAPHRLAELGPHGRGVGRAGGEDARRDHQAQHAGARRSSSRSSPSERRGRRARRSSATFRPTCWPPCSFEPSVDRRSGRRRRRRRPRRRPRPLDASRLRRREEQIARDRVRAGPPAPAMRAAVEGSPPARRLPAPSSPAATSPPSSTPRSPRRCACPSAPWSRGRSARGARLRLAADRRDHRRAAASSFPWLPGHAALRAPLGQRRSSQEIVRLSQPHGASPAVGRAATAPAAPPRPRCRRRHRRRRHARPVRRRQLAGRAVGAAEHAAAAPSRPVPADRPHFLRPLADDRPHWAGLLDDVGRFDAEFFGVSPREAEFMDPAAAAVPRGGVGRARGRRRRRRRPRPRHRRLRRRDVRRLRRSAPTPVARRRQPVPLLGRFQPREPAVAAARLPRPEPGRRHGVLVVGHGAAPRLQRAARGRVPRRRRRRRQPDSRSRSLRLARPARHSVDAAAGASRSAPTPTAPCSAKAPASSCCGRSPTRCAAATASTASSRAPASAPAAARSASRRRIRRRRPRPFAAALRAGARRSAHDLLRRDARHRHRARRSDRGARPDARLRRRRAARSGAGGRAPRARIGSIKPNIGHLEAGAGVVGLIKVLLQLAARHAACRRCTSAQPNPQIPFGQTPFDVQRELAPWPRLDARVDGRAVDGAAPRRPQLVRRRRRQRARHRRGGARGRGAGRRSRRERPAARAGAVGAQRRRRCSVKPTALARLRRAHAGDASRRPRASALNTGRKHFAHRVALVGGEPRRSWRAGARRGAGAGVATGERAASAAEGRVPLHRPGLAVRRHGARAVRDAAGLPRRARSLRRDLRHAARPAAAAICCSPPTAAPTASCSTRPATRSRRSSPSSTRWPSCGSRGASSRTS